MHRPLVAAAALALATTLARGARAQSCDGSASTCIDADTLWVPPGATRFVALGSTETLAPGRVGFGVVTSLQSRPLVLQSPSPPPNGTETTAIDLMVTSSFVFAWGVARAFELDAVMPVTVWQRGAGLSAVTGGGALPDTALRDLRFGFTWSVAPRSERSPWSFALRSHVVAPTGDDRQLAGERGVAWNPLAILDARAGRFFGTAAVGARVRGTSDLLGARFGTQAELGLGGGVDVFRRPDALTVALEARALPTLVEQGIPVTTRSGLTSRPGGPPLVPAEWLASVRTAVLCGGDLAIQAGAGAALPFANGEASPTAPRFRVVLGVRYAPGTGVSSVSGGGP